MKNKVAFLKKPFAVQIKLRKVATKLQNVSPSAGSLLPMVISLKKYLSIAPKFSLRICQIKRSFSQGLKICQCLLERWNDMAAAAKLQQAVALQSVNTFSVALDESVAIDDIPCLAIIA